MERKRLKKNKDKLNLTSMSPKELKEIRAKIDFLLNNTIPDADEYSYKLFYDILTEKLHRLLQKTYQPYPVFKKQKTQNKKLIEVVDLLDKLIQSMFDKPKKLYYNKLYRLYITLVINEIEDSPLPLELPVILNYKDKFYAILDNNFPGYLQNNLLKTIFLKKA